MSHAVGPNSGHSPRVGTRTTRKPGAAPITDVVKVFARLLPKQLKDEAQLAVLELKEKGIKVGVGAAFAVVGLIFLGLAVIALVGAAISGLSHIMPAWLAALLLAVVFLILLAVLALIGVAKIKSALPLVPEKTIFGLRYDLGVIKEGSAYNEGRVQRDINEAEQKKQREKEEAANDPNQVKPIKPTEEQLRNRLKLRREHMKSLRDDAQNRAESVQSATTGFVNRTTRTFHSTQETVKASFASKGRSQGPRSAGSTAVSDTLSERWQPLAVAVTAGTAFFVFLRKLLKK